MTAKALISVSDKTGLVPFAKALHALGITLLSTGKTAALLQAHDLPVIQVTDYTGSPEMLEGRVKTLHPKIHAGLLARKNHPTDQSTLTAHHIPCIDIVVVNLYPFQDTVAQPDCTLEQAVEQIDIGGPTLLRAGAKNYSRVTVIVDPRDYTRIHEELSSHQGTTLPATRAQLACKAFAHTAGYDAAITNYLGSVIYDDALPEVPLISYSQKQPLRYGENPHQKAAFYIASQASPGCIGSAKQIQGKPLSYNNIADIDAGLSCIQQFDEPACVIIKHTNPCGVAVSDCILTAYGLAFKADSISAFGGIIVLNRPLDSATAAHIIQQQFVEVIVAPLVEEGAKTCLNNKPNVRLLACGSLPFSTEGNGQALQYRSVSGGLLVQEVDKLTIDLTAYQASTLRQPTLSERRMLSFAWKVAGVVKSNAIVLAKNQMTIGIGAGQMSRIDSARLAIDKAIQAGFSTQGSVLASDAFFPFPDSIESAAKAGVTAIIQPGGSTRDQSVIEAAEAADITMILTGTRHFKHS